MWVGSPGVVWSETTCDNDAGIIGISLSASTDVLALLGKKLPWLMAGGNAWPFFLFGLDCQKWILNQNPRTHMDHPG